MRQGAVSGGRVGRGEQRPRQRAAYCCASQGCEHSACLNEVWDVFSEALQVFNCLTSHFWAAAAAGSDGWGVSMVRGTVLVRCAPGHSRPN